MPYFSIVHDIINLGENKNTKFQNCSRLSHMQVKIFMYKNLTPLSNNGFLSVMVFFLRQPAYSGGHQNMRVFSWTKKT